MNDKRDEAQLLYCCAMYAMLSLYAERNTDGDLAWAIERKAFDPPMNAFAGLFFDLPTASAASEAICVEDLRAFTSESDAWTASILALRVQFEASIVALMRAASTRHLHVILQALVHGCEPRRLAGEVKYIGEPNRFEGVAPGDVGSVDWTGTESLYEVTFVHEEPHRYEVALIPAELLEQVSLASRLPSRESDPKS